MIYKFFELRNRLPKFLTKLIPKFIKKKINKKFFNFYFIPTNYSKLLNDNYINNNNYDYQKKLIDNYKHNFQQNSFMTYPNLIELLLMKFNSDDEIMFLDMGADNIDFFLELNSKFKNVRYFFCNLKSVNSIFEKLKNENSYKNMFIIDTIDEVSNKNFDFINFGSSIEYFENYELVLNKVSKIGKYIFFSGTTLFETKNEKYNKHIIVKQVNMYPDINYLYFFNKQYFYSIFLKNNFKLLFEKKNLTDNVNYHNFHKIFENTNYMDFLFSKIE
jgi:hypothetical protein